MAGPRVKKIAIGDREISEGNFYKHQQPDPQTGCIVWTGVTSNIGYGFIGWIRRGYKSGVPGHHGMMTVHRAALAIKLGRDIAPGMNANHTCHNKLCVNPAHLEEGTQQEKIHAMIASGYNIGGLTNTGPRTPRKQNRTYRYSEADIRWARTAELDEIQQRFSVNRKQASAIRHGFRSGYKWIT